MPIRSSSDLQFSEMHRRPAVVLPMASCGAGGDQKMMASFGGVVSIGSSRASEQVIGSALVLTKALSLG
ncbi:Protein Phosphatase 1 Regulatory Subunit 3F [Manis pentadactyla]|nr:Protein Phosphatase 1 Regulatory Subunit 3F [Manis pentadactyla]